MSADMAYIQLLSLQYQEVNNNSMIDVEIINNSSGDIMVENNNVMVVNKEGTYFIGWWTNITDDGVTISLLRESDMEVLSSSNAPSKFNTIKGNAIIKLAAGTKLVFVNDSGTKKNVDPIRSGVSMNVCIHLIEGGC